MDWFNEIWNSLIFHFSGYAPAWAAPGETAYLILIGLNIEICFMFAILGIVTTVMLPSKDTKILGLPNRWVFAVFFSALAVFIEYLLNAVDALTWDYSWWNRSAPWLIFLVGYLPFLVVAYWVHDMKCIKRQAVVVGAILSFERCRSGRLWRCAWLDLAARRRCATGQPGRLRRRAVARVRNDAGLVEVDEEGPSASSSVARPWGSSIVSAQCGMLVIGGSGLPKSISIMPSPWGCLEAHDSRPQTGRISGARLTTPPIVRAMMWAPRFVT